MKLGLDETRKLGLEEAGKLGLEKVGKLGHLVAYDFVDLRAVPFSESKSQVDAG